jgi:putative ABC transport system substrate-binding protein
MAQKWLQMLKETAPSVARVGLFQNPRNADWPGYRDAVSAVAPSLGVEFIGNPVRDDAEIERAMADLARKPNGGIVALPDVFLNARRDQFVALAAQHRLPAIYPYRSFVASGGLMSYGPDLLDIWRRSASYVDRILRGEKPTDLPVQAPTKYELVINLKTAKTLGLELPPTLLARADEVIE